MVFVMGAPRSGTTWLGSILAGHPQIAGVASESHLFDVGVDRLFHNHEVQQEWSRHLIGFVSRPQLVDLVRDLCDGVLLHMREDTKPEARLVVEKTPVGADDPLLHVARKLECYPDAWYVHIVREENAVVESLMRTPWVPDSSRAGCTRLWRESVGAIREVLGQAERYREIAYEELVGDTAGVSASLFEWLGLEWDAGVAERVEVVSRQEHAAWGEAMHEPAPAPRPDLRGRLARWRASRGRARGLRGPAEWSGPVAAFIEAFTERDHDAMRRLTTEAFELEVRSVEGDHRSSGDEARGAMAAIAHELFDERFTSATWASSDHPGLHGLWFSGLRGDAARVDLSVGLVVDGGQVRRVALLTPSGTRGRHPAVFAPGEDGR